MPVPFAVLVGFLIGVGFAWAARAEIAKDDDALFSSRLLSRPVVIALAFAGLVYAPIAGYFLAFHGDWAYLYLVDSGRVPSAVGLFLVVLVGGTVPLGALAALPAARARRLNSVLRMAAGPAALAFALLAWSMRRLTLSATYAQFHGSFGTESLGSSTLGRGILWMAIVGTLGIAWSLQALRSSSHEESNAARS